MWLRLGVVPLLLLIPLSSTSAVPLTPVKAEPVGPGGGGAMFWPAISPHDPKLMFVSCDMNGFYRSEDGGHTWSMLDGRQMHGTYRPNSHVMFPPGDPDPVFAYGYAGGAGALNVSGALIGVALSCTASSLGLTRTLTTF